MTVYERAAQLLKQNPKEKVKIIKILREEYGLELKTAKEIVDSVGDGSFYMDDAILRRETKGVEERENDTGNDVTIKISNKEKGELLIDFKKMKKSIDELLSVQSELDTVARSLKEKQEEENKIKEKKGLVGTLFNILAMFMIVIGFAGGLFGIIVMLIIAGITAVLGDKIGGAIVKDKYIKRAEEYHNKNVAPLIEEAKKYKVQIDQIWETEGMILYEKMIPEEYRQLDILEYFIRALETGRAETQKELFNLYEEDSHRRKMEAMQNEMLTTQQKQLDVSKQQADKLASIQKNQKHISKQVKYGNTINTLDFLFKK